jgi:hypothetical protein
MVVAGLWILSVIGNWANFLTPNGGVLGDLRMGGGQRMDVGMDGRGRGPECAHTEWAWAWAWAWSVEVKQSKGKHVPKFRSQEICCTKKKHLLK